VDDSWAFLRHLQPLWTPEICQNHWNWLFHLSSYVKICLGYIDMAWECTSCFRTEAARDTTTNLYVYIMRYNYNSIHTAIWTASSAWAQLVTVTLRSAGIRFSLARWNSISSEENHLSWKALGADFATQWHLVWSLHQWGHHQHRIFQQLWPLEGSQQQSQEHSA